MNPSDTTGKKMQSGALHRVHNFNPGPAALPLSVLQQAQAELLDFQGTGMSVMEVSHRSDEFDQVALKAEADLRKLYGIPDNYKVIFQQGGASLQFAMTAMNLRPAGASADYIVNGSWGQAAIKDAKKLGEARLAGSSEETNFDRVPAAEALDLDPKAAYLHFTSNETIHGVEFQSEPVAPEGVPLVCDMSSNFVSKPVDISKYGVIYAGAQKNAGPAGVTLVILREDLLERTPAKLPVMLDYKVQVDKASMHNTPPCFAIYIVGLVFQWLLDEGGLEAVARRNAVKAQMLYRAIDESGGYYRGHAMPESRSKMNVPFRLPSEELEKRFCKEAEKEDLIGLKGHRSVGGLRASIYNAVTEVSVKTLTDFMQEFHKKNG